jgi:subtilisin family serine protease
MMKRHIESSILLVTFGALFAIQAAAQNRQFILHADPAKVPSILARHGLNALDQVPLQGVVLVSDPSGGDGDDDDNGQVDNDNDVDNFERVGLSMAPETLANLQLNQSTTAILDTLPGRTLTTYFGVTTVSNYVTQTAAQLINLATARSIYNATGAGIVAIIDTGIDPNHSLLRASVVPGYDFTRNQPGIPNEMNDLDPNTASLLQGQTPELGKSSVVSLNQSTTAILDSNQANAISPANLPAAFGHGTMIAGIVHLVAPTAQIMPLKAFRADGSANSYDIVRAIYFATDNGASVINMSFGLAAPSTEVMRAVDYATDHGVICVSSAGNNGKETMVYPASMVTVVGVASTDNNDQRSKFSNYGSSIAHMAAPGEGIVTTYPGNNYAAAWGTSFSAAFVTGTAALLEQFAPGLTIHQATDALRNAKPLGLSLGYGRLDVQQALTDIEP